jgi:hypothetical protein
VVAGAGSSGTTQVLSGAADVTAVQGTITNSSGMGVTLTQITVADSGSGNPLGITSVIVLINGTQQGPAAAFNGNPVNINLNSYILPSGPGQSVQILANFSGTANGTYTLSISSMSGTSANNGGQPASFSNFPIVGNIVVVAQPTSTPTFSPTLTFTITPTVSPTSTTSSTPVPQKYPVIYPNPVDGTSPVNVRPPAFMGVSDVKVQIFTLAYRKVQEKTYKNQVAGQDCPISLKDSWNIPLANGIYYVVVTTNSGRSIGKMLILR